MSSAARKVRANIPDQSGLVFQSFYPCGGKPSPSQHHPVSHGYVRRYSSSQEETDDALKSSEVLAKFNTTLTQTHMLAKPGGSSTNIYSNFTSYGSDVSHPFDAGSSLADVSPKTSATSSILTRVKSSPHLSVLPSFRGSPPKDSELVRRHQSHNDLLEVAENKDDNRNDAPPNSENALVLPSSLKPDASKFESDVTEQALHQNSGFGILSRTRQFGAWLVRSTEGEKMEVTKKDLNVLAPNSF